MAINSDTPENPALKDLDRSTRDAIVSHFDEYYAPAQNLSAPNRSVEGRTFVFSKFAGKDSNGIERETVRLVVEQVGRSGFVVTSGIVCTSEVSLPGAAEKYPVAIESEVSR